MYESKRLSIRQMRFVMYLGEFIFNGTRRAYLAGYSKHSARWQAWRLSHSVQIRIFQDWWTRNLLDGCFDTKERVTSLKRRLAEVGYTVDHLDIRVAEATLKPFSYDNISKKDHKFVKSLRRDTFGYKKRVGNTLVTKLPRVSN